LKKYFPDSKTAVNVDCGGLQPFFQDSGGQNLENKLEKIGELRG
jgi:hypothetical protein